MSLARSIRQSVADRRGFTLAETLVGLTIGAAVSAATAGVFFTASRTQGETDLRVETHHGLVVALEAMTRDLRLAGACLPPLGMFVSLAGNDDGIRDSITTRIGRIQGNQVCIRATVAADAILGGTRLALETIDGFEPGFRVFLSHPNGSGEFATIGTLDVGGLFFDSVEPLLQDYPPGSGVFAFEERTFAIDTATYGRPVLTLALDEGDPSPLADAIERLDLRYRLRRNCPPCDEVTFPADDTEWRLVNEIVIDVGARSRTRAPSGGFYRRATQVAIKPRNLLP